VFPEKKGVSKVRLTSNIKSVKLTGLRSYLPNTVGRINRLQAVVHGSSVSIATQLWGAPGTRMLSKWRQDHVLVWLNSWKPTLFCLPGLKLCSRRPDWFILHYYSSTVSHFYLRN